MLVPLSVHHPPHLSLTVSAAFYGLLFVFVFTKVGGKYNPTIGSQLSAGDRFKVHCKNLTK